jgi:tubulin polyglutamylase TTLL6/13
VNKENPKFVENMESNEDSAHKRGTTSVFAEMRGLGVDVEVLQARIDEVIQLTLLAVQQAYIDDYRKTVKAQDERSRLFEILGFDILIDAGLKPWLIEVNNNVSLVGGSPFDDAIKLSVIKGALEIVNITQSFKRQLMARERANGRRPVFDGRKESERALATNWRQVLPVDESHPKYGLFEAVSRLVLVKH